MRRSENYSKGLPLVLVFLAGLSLLITATGVEIRNYLFDSNIQCPETSVTTYLGFLYRVQCIDKANSSN